MYKYFQVSNLDLTFLENDFFECEFQCFDMHITSDDFITAFTCIANNNKILDSNWEQISSLICAEYQTKLYDEFSRWNIYLVFLSSQPVENKIKYEIENDKFAVRKIVIDNLKDKLDDNKIIELLNERILSSDISLDGKTVSSDNQKFQLSTLTSRLLSLNLPLGNTNEDKQKRSAWLDNELARIKTHELKSNEI